MMSVQPQNAPILLKRRRASTVMIWSRMCFRRSCSCCSFDGDESRNKKEFRERKFGQTSADNPAMIVLLVRSWPWKVQGVCSISKHVRGSSADCGTKREGVGEQQSERVTRLRDVHTAHQRAVVHFERKYSAQASTPLTMTKLVQSSE